MTYIGGMSDMSVGMSDNRLPYSLLLSPGLTCFSFGFAALDLPFIDRFPFFRSNEAMKFSCISSWWIIDPEVLSPGRKAVCFVDHNTAVRTSLVTRISPNEFQDPFNYRKGSIEPFRQNSFI